jgi:hypothetical protein
MIKGLRGATIWSEDLNNLRTLATPKDPDGDLLQLLQPRP